MTDAEQERAFLEDICEHPDGDAARLIFADWLEDRNRPGDAARAEFIRVQYALTDDELPSDQRHALHERERQLLDEHEAEWCRPLHDLGAIVGGFARGFPEKIHISAADLLKNADKLFGTAPLRELRILSDLPEPVLSELIALPYIQNLTALDLACTGIGDRGVRRLAASPKVCNLTRIDLSGNALTDGGVQALAASPHLADLRRLDLGLNAIGDPGVQALADSPHLANLRRLELDSNAIGDRGAQALAASPWLTKLGDLSLGNNGVEDAGALALARSPTLVRLTRLDLSSNNLGPETLREIDRQVTWRRVPTEEKEVRGK